MNIIAHILYLNITYIAFKFHSYNLLQGNLYGIKIADYYKFYQDKVSIKI